MASDNAPVTALALAPAAPEWTREQKELIKRTCVPVGEAPSDDAFAVFLHVCQRTGLDPMLHEAWLISRRSKDARGNWSSTWQTMAGRDGYLAAAHRTGELRGIQTMVFPEDAAKPPTHATCSVWRANWSAPVVCTVAFSEYASDSPLWRGKPRTMIAKVAESHALRRAFSLHGTYTPEEMPDDAPALPAPRPLAEVLPTVRPAALPAASDAPTVAEREAADAFAERGSPFADLADPPAAIEPPRLASEAQRRLVYARVGARAKATGAPPKEIGAALCALFGIESSAELLAERVDDALHFVAGWTPPQASAERAPGEEG
jgi:phage recombination protein Bet